MSKANMGELFLALGEDLSDADFSASIIQGLIASEISMRRADLHMNQKEFAEFMGVSQGLVSRWERGETNFTIQTLAVIAAKLGIDLQCPFVMKAPAAYNADPGNVINFYEASGFAVSPPVSYSLSYEDLKEN